MMAHDTSAAASSHGPVTNHEPVHGYRPWLRTLAGGVQGL
jgi:hypothetical protein